MEAFRITTQEHHVIFHIPYDNQWFEWWLTPQDAVDFHCELGIVLERMSNAAEGRMYDRPLFTLEIGQAMEARNRGVRSVEVGEVEA